ncbi:MAG TPA: long-chain fatty acid--CoA ligase [Spirochaetota bacterium]|nr:long-chain fatty acid--CoA ligase [Spirochaetota bacterium]HPI87824.1 long-chain fatty acid--CoA ligase [Spirochaetota bacterium]HPR47551.1 long-chain fatty acid--CoA ligase [Spirochaetota bacterium]
MESMHLVRIFEEQVKKLGTRNLMNFRDNGKWIELSWAQVGERVHALAGALINLGVMEQENVVIFSQNRPEWTIADLGIQRIRSVPVSIYPTESLRHVEYIINDAEISTVFVGDQDQYDIIMEIFSRNSHLKKVIVFNERVKIEKSDRVVYFSDFLEAGRRSNHEKEIQQRISRMSLDDHLTLIYTGGTTGEPKGVILTYANMAYQAEAHNVRLEGLDDSDVSLCYLPLSHVFERMWTFNCLYRGIRIFYLDNPGEIVNFVQEVKPTVMCIVPRFAEKIYAAIHKQFESATSLEKLVFACSIKAGKKYHNRIKDRRFISPLVKLNYNIADRVVLKRMRSLVGGRIKFMPCAGAPLAREIEEFFYAIGVFMLHGYGLTETSATVTCHEFHGFEFGTVGKPLPGVEIKIDDQTGEIMIRGRNVMKGYYNKPAENAEVFAEDGFFKTGDGGIFEENGELRITERIKEIMKTSGGKYIAPQNIEGALNRDRFIEQSVVCGNGKNFVSALIVPDYSALREYSREKGLEYSCLKELLVREDIISLYRERIEHCTQHFARFEKIKKFTLIPDHFTIEKGEITVTQKIRRKVIEDHYRELIDSMYIS